jgi:hypothetical protein
MFTEHVSLRDAPQMAATAAAAVQTGAWEPTAKQQPNPHTPVGCPHLLCTLYYTVVHVTEAPGCTHFHASGTSPTVAAAAAAAI